MTFAESIRQTRQRLFFSQEAFAKELKLVPLMKDAFQEALLCTNDPECMSNVPAGNNLNGAACHSCCMISETACENGNRMLDRGLVVPIALREKESFFRELVCELCQLEI